jgi:SAM-dependent methyltransferase
VLICPDCAAPIDAGKPAICAACGWAATTVEDIDCFLSRRDGTDAVVAEYLNNYDEIARDDLHSSFVDERYIENQAKNMMAGARLEAGESVCDLGAGKGYLIRALLDAGADQVTAVDISLPYLRRFKNEPRIRPIVANAENLPFVEEFDTIFCTDVMEHVLNLGSFLFSMSRALKLGGRAHVRVPYLENLLSYSPHVGCRYRFVHLRSFDRALLRRTFEDVGFAVERFRLDGFSPGSPQPFWMHGSSRAQCYAYLRQWALRHIEHEMDMTRWPSRLAMMFMRPTTITVTVRKCRRIIASESSGYRLVEGIETARVAPRLSSQAQKD